MRMDEGRMGVRDTILLMKEMWVYVKDDIC